MRNRVLRLVIDVVKHCNLRCAYCHPGEVWEKGHLPVEAVREVLAAAVEANVLEVVISGGEPSLHPRFGALAEVIAQSQVPSTVMVTNATRTSPRYLDEIAACGLRRLCVSVDGATAGVHATARGDNFARVWKNLTALRERHDNITVISVAHKANLRELPALTKQLAAEGLASQHHICAPSYSGIARQHYAALRLDLDDYVWLQQRIDESWQGLSRRGVFVTFNSYWPATGNSARTPPGRRVTLQQLSEQVKGTLVHVRPDGEFRLAAISWGRETVGRGDLGFVDRDDPLTLFELASRANAEARVQQLPREVEAVHKFQLHDLGSTRRTDLLIDSDDHPSRVVEKLIPAIPIAASHLMARPLDDTDLELVRRASSRRDSTALTAEAGGAMLAFDAHRSHVVPLTYGEWHDVCAVESDGAVVAG